MVKELDFGTPDELMEYLMKHNGHHFSCTRSYERFVTTHTWEGQASITLHWQGVVSEVGSTRELLDLQKRGVISMVKERTEIMYRPFNPVKRRRLTKNEYVNLESAKNISEERFEQFMKSMQNEQKFEEYLREKEKEEQ